MTRHFLTSVFTSAVLLALAATPAQAGWPEATKAGPAAAQQGQELGEILQKLDWKLIPGGAKKLEYGEAIRRNLEENPDIMLSSEKIEETRAKQDSVEGKRLLFFFKYFNSDYVEGAAESDVDAATAHRDAVVHESLLNISQAYFDLIRAHVGTYLAYQRIRQGLKELALGEDQFERGEATSLMLIQTRTRLNQRYGNYLKAKNNRLAASKQLTVPLKLNADLLFPKALKYDDQRFETARMELVPRDMDESTAEALALRHRPELKELAFRTVSVENLIKAHAAQFDHTQVKIMRSSLHQLQIREEKARRAIMATVDKSYADWVLACERLPLAERRLELAETAYRQVDISREAGFSSEKDVLDTRVALDKAQLDYIDAVLNYNQAQVRLLYETGLISAEALLGEKSLEALL